MNLIINVLVENMDKPPLLKLTHTTVYTPQTNPLCINYIPVLENGVYVKKVINGEVVDRPQIEIDSWYNKYQMVTTNKKQFNDLWYETFTFDNYTFLLDNKSRWYYEHLRDKTSNTDIQAVEGVYNINHRDINAFITEYEKAMKSKLIII